MPQALAGPAIDGRGDVVAIAGYFGIPVVPTGCGDGIDPLGPLCDRSTLLAELQWSLVGSQGFSGIGPHVHARAASASGSRQQVQRTTMAASGPPLTAVLIGRFGGFLQPGCTAPNVGCEVGFELDAVAWAEGSPFEVRPFVDPMIEAGPADWLTINQARVGTEVVGSNGIVLEAALLRPETLARLDPRAARRIRKADPGGVRVVRARPQASRPGGGAPELVWGVVDDTTLRMLAKGVAAAAGDPMSRDGLRAAAPVTAAITSRRRPGLRRSSAAPRPRSSRPSSGEFLPFDRSVAGLDAPRRPAVDDDEVRGLAVAERASTPGAA